MNGQPAVAATAIVKGIDMQRMVFVLAIWIAATTVAPASAFADFATGLAAYNKGNYGAALKEWRPLAEQGVAGAQYALGAMYYDGKGVTQNFLKAAQWHRKAAEQGLVTAQFVLGAMFRRGEGVGRDFAKAAYWYREAAEQGFAEAQLNLGALYQNGRGVPRDLDEALRWYNRAAEGGFVAAQLVLGKMYKDGAGVSRNFVQAHKWYNIAAARGDADGIKNRDLIAQQMTLDQVAEAQDLAKEWWDLHML